MTAWLGVAAAEHVARGVSLGIAQIGHGKRAGLARMRSGDTLIYYSPTRQLGDQLPLRQFSAVGVLRGDDIWQADEGSFRPFRRAVDYRAAHPVPVAELKDVLELTADPHWGYQLRRGLIELSAADAQAIESAMTES